MPGLLARLVGDERGTVAVMFALLVVPVAGIASTAIDYGRASHARTQIQRAVDAAGESAREVLHWRAKELADHVRTQVAANLPLDLKSVPVEVKIAADRRSLEIAVETDVVTTLMSIVGVPKLRIEVVNVVTRRERPETGPAFAPGGGPATLPPDAERIARDLVGGGHGGIGSGGLPSSGPVASPVAGNGLPQVSVDQLPRELRGLVAPPGGAPQMSQRELEAELARVLDSLRRR